MSLDIFTGNAFNVINLTARANNPDIVPHVPSRLGDLGIFTQESVSSTSVAVERRNGTIALLPSKERGGVPNINVRDSRTARNLNVPHIPVQDQIMADEVQNVRAFGTEDRETIMSIVDSRMVRMDRNIAATQEYLRIGAVKGVVTDGDGSTVLHNLYTEFGVSAPAPVNFVLGTATTDVRGKCSEVVRGIQDALGNVPFTYVHGLCSSEFFDALVGHAKVEKAWERYLDGEQLRTRTVGQSMFFGGILFEEYRGAVGATRYVAANTARFFPVGTPGLFVEYYAPANYLETVNTLGIPRYAKVAIDTRFQKFADLELQANPLPICTRPEVLWHATAS